MCELEDFTIVSVLQFSHHDIKVKKSRKSMYNLFWVNWEWPLSHLTFAQWWSARFHQRSCLFSSVQALSRVRLCNPMDWSMKRCSILIIFQFSSVQLLSHVRLFVTPWIAACQASLSITNSKSYSNSCPSSPWCHPAISSSVVPFCCLPSFLPSQSFPISQFFTSGGQSIGVSISA